MKILTLYHLKGGVGKTAAAVNLSYLAAAEGRRVLLCDLDPQGSASYYFRMRPARKVKVGKLLKSAKFAEKQVRESDYENLFLMPSDLVLRQLDAKLEAGKKSRSRLKRLFAGMEDEYDLIVVDAPPAITLLAENLFRASDLLLLPIIPTVLAHQAMLKVMEFMETEGLDTSRVRAFFSMADRRKKLHREFMKQLSADATRFLPAAIPYASAVENMGLERRPLPDYDRRSPATKAYRELWAQCAKLL
ncbi:ParA family protein [Ruficoccus amylovorans]|uniref:ParA family protein n=1 Tax=Ruficoccus amylovorans TaxID=1804625 RepID=A0A842HDF3_9BACT|nr:ParA family protein [Ruficoccus amylovorans]MBC2593574.1 ParA family protein [Ruficoccus amylovorans]